MLYHSLKIMHILSAAILLTSMAYSIYLWQNTTLQLQRIQTQTFVIILPAMIFQLLTGFTIVSVQHEDFTQWWIRGSIIGFITMIASWLSFMFCLFSASKLIKKIQIASLTVCILSLASMIFFMANKV